jgi:hypothetical protein
VTTVPDATDPTEDHTTDLGTLLAADGTLDLGTLEAALQDGLVAVGRFTDEELHWLRDADEVAEDPLEAPRLATLPPEARRAALDATLCLLLARGDLTTVPGAPGEDDDLAATGRHAVLATLREEPLGVLRSRVEHREHGVSYAAVYRVSDGALLLEDVDPVGIHTFVFARPDQAAAWVRRRIDPDDVARSGSPPRTARDVDSLEVDLDAVLAGASSVGLLDLAWADGDEVRTSALSVYAGRHGVSVLEGWLSEDDGEVRYQQLDAAGVTSLALQLVTDAIRPRPVPDEAG